MDEIWNLIEDFFLEEIFEDIPIIIEEQEEQGDF